MVSVARVLLEKEETSCPRGIWMKDLGAKLKSIVGVRRGYFDVKKHVAFRYSWDFFLAWIILWKVLGGVDFSISNALNLGPINLSHFLLSFFLLFFILSSFFFIPFFALTILIIAIGMPIRCFSTCRANRGDIL